MGNLFSPPSRPAPAPVVQQILAPSPDSGEAAAAATAAAEKQRKAASLAKGAASNILTGGMGVQDEAPTSRKKLFGE